MIYSPELFGSPSKTIMDPVHGSIPIFAHEMSVIDDKLFQRLRHILQNDVVFLVFPGAKHNRLLHSIGTMHMVSSMFTHITSSYLSTKAIVEVTTAQRESIQYIHCCLRLAGLLHDAGHCPFSHQFEHADAIASILTPELYKNLWNEEDYRKIYPTELREITHENFSVRVAHEILTRQQIITSRFTIEDIVFFLETTQNQPSQELMRHCKNFIGIFFKDFDQFVVQEELPKILRSFLKFLKAFISGELDADKMDYILRDSYFSGCRYGMYNKDHLINSLRLGYEYYRSEPNGKIFDFEFNLAIMEKGLGALEDFIYARYQLYLELYNHKTVSGFRKLLTLSLNEILYSEEDRDGIKEMLYNSNNFSSFTDTFFWEKFRSHAKDNPGSACEWLVSRRPLPYIGKRVNEAESEVNLFCKRLSRTKNRNIDYWKSKVKFSEINESFNKIKILVKKEDGKIALKKISRVTDFFTKFDRKDIYHLFEIPFETK